ncbi:MAG: hypothetical protein H8D87_18465 [Deltaproteobacteria bacterium]|nr:hypothetical protein [Candidatus Desulfobacula maris]
MIYKVTLNPALDRFILVEQLLTEDTNRIISETPSDVEEILTKVKITDL